MDWKCRENAKLTQILGFWIKYRTTKSGNKNLADENKIILGIFEQIFNSAKFEIT